MEEFLRHKLSGVPRVLIYNMNVIKYQGKSPSYVLDYYPSLIAESASLEFKKF